MEKRVYTKSYTTIDVHSIEEGYQRLGEAVVALAFQDYYNGEIMKRKLDGADPLSYEYRTSAHIIKEGASAKRWLTSSPDASFYAGPNVDIQSIMKVVNGRLEDK